MVAALTRIFGVHNLALAEDVVQDAFCRALEVWKLRGIPENPSAWLMRTARNRAIDVLRRQRTAREFAPDLKQLFDSEWTLVPTVDEFFAANAIKDDQLRMMFSCCQQQLSEQAQVAMMLQLICGFSVAEIASAFLSNRAAIEKRISRAKKALAESKGLFDLTGRDFAARISAVHRAIYLLFNEGYHSASTETIVRAELCREAMRLAALLREHPLTSTSATFALSALMCFNAARLPARVDAAGNLSSLAEQDRTLWDKTLIAEGKRLLDISATGSSISQYHLEAAIACVHTRAHSVEETDWRQIVVLYDALLELAPSPVVALNRAIAVAQIDGPQRGLDEIGGIAENERLTSYPFYWAAQGELELRLGRTDAARKSFDRAVGVARNPMERRFLQQRSDTCAAETPRQKNSADLSPV